MFRIPHSVILAGLIAAARCAAQSGTPVVPASLKDGDQEITATQGGSITQPGVFLTVQH